MVQGAASRRKETEVLNVCKDKRERETAVLEHLVLEIYHMIPWAV